MSHGKIGGRRLKSEVLELLSSEDLSRSLEALLAMPLRQVINPLFSFILSTDLRIKWAAVTAIGAVVAKLADEDMESARVVMRRLMWQLNDESGGIGWGCPESIGEIMACHQGLAREYAQVLISYIRADGNFLEYEPLQQGALWSIARVSEVNPVLLLDSIPHLLSSLEAKDATLRGLAAWALGMLKAKEARAKIEGLCSDVAEIEIYRGRHLMVCRVSTLAKEALKRLKQLPPSSQTS